MKRTLLSLVGAALLAVGCVQGTPGGPGANPPATPPGSSNTTTAHKPTFSPNEESFSLNTPTLATHVKQGESKSATISMSRGKNFDEDVTLKFENVPMGVTITPAAPMIKHGETEAKVTVDATADAAVGNFTVKVVGHPPKGQDATNDFKLTVDEK